MATIQTILVSDASEEITSKIETLVRNQPELSFVKTVGLNEAQESISGKSSTIVWVELESDSEKGLKLLKSLVDSNPGSYFVVSKEEIDADLVKRAMQMGALDFLDHQGWNAQIRSVIRRVATKEWGAQKSSKAMRSAIPNANIKKSGAWSIPGKQAHKPITYAKPPTKTISTNLNPVQSEKPKTKPPSLEIKKPIAKTAVDKPKSEAKPEAVEITKTTSAKNIEQDSSITDTSKKDTSSNIDSQTKPVESIESTKDETKVESSQNVPDPISDLIKNAESATAAPAFPEEEPTVEDLPPENEATAQSKPLDIKYPEVEPEINSLDETDKKTIGKTGFPNEEPVEDTVQNKSPSSNNDDNLESLPDKKPVDDTVQDKSPSSNNDDNLESLPDKKPVDDTVQGKLPSSQNDDELKSLPDEEPEEFQELLPEEESEEISEKEAVAKEEPQEVVETITNKPISSPVQAENPVKKSKWEELDSLISTQRSSQAKIDTINDPVKSVRQGVLSSDTKDALVDAVDSIDAGVEKDVVDEEDKAKTDIKVAKSDELDSAVAPKNPTNFLPEMSSVDIDILPMNIMEDDLSSVQKANEEKKKQIPNAETAPNTNDPDGYISDPSLDVVATKSKWGDLDTIGTTSSNTKILEEPTPIQEEVASTSSIEQKSKWGDLDSIPTPGKETETKQPSSEPKGKWGDLDSINSPQSSEAPALEQSAKSGMFSDIDGLDDVKKEDDPGTASQIASAKWGGAEGSAPGIGSRSRVSGIGRNTGSFSSLQSDPNTSLVDKDQANPNNQSTQEDGAEEEKPKAMPMPQAQAPNKWTGSGESSGTSVSSSLKSMDDKSSKPLLQKPDIKLSLSLSSTIASGLVASIVAILICFLSASFFLY